MRNWRSSEGTDEVPADAPVYVPAIVDLPGDPMWINLSARQRRRNEGPLDGAAGRTR